MLSFCSWSLSTFLIAALTASTVVAQPARSLQSQTAGPPRFEDFPAHAGAPNRSADLVLTGRARTYRTRLRAAVAERSNFAGHYILVTWGCGTECLMGAAISARTGRVIFLPFATRCTSAAPGETGDMVTFRRDSSLGRLVGFRDVRQPSPGAHYYRVTAARFEYLRSISLPARR